MIHLSGSYHTSSSQHGGDMQYGVNPHLIENAKQEALILIRDGSEIRPVPFGGRGLDSIFVSTNSDLVLCEDAFVLEGINFLSE